VALLPDRLGKAMGLPEPSQTVVRLIHAMFYIRAFVIRHLFLPKMKPYEFCPMNLREPSIWASPSAKDPNGGRMHTHMRKREPWYFPPLKGRRLYLEKVLLWLCLKKERYLPGPRYQCEGYRIEELGPVEKAEVGHEEVFREASQFLGSKVDRDWSERFRP